MIQGGNIATLVKNGVFHNTTFSLELYSWEELKTAYGIDVMVKPIETLRTFYNTPHSFSKVEHKIAQNTKAKASIFLSIFNTVPSFLLTEWEGKTEEDMDIYVDLPYVKNAITDDGVSLEFLAQLVYKHTRHCTVRKSELTK
jgi:hypothetical protein